MPLLVATAASLIRLCRTPSTRAAFASGVLSGLTTITRSTALLAWIVVWPLCWLAAKGEPRRGSVIAVLVATTLAIFSLITIRNWIVARVFAPTSTELGITLLGGNEVPPDLQIDPAVRSPIYQRFGIDDPTATVIQYAINAPGRFAQNLGRKALFALGFYEPYAQGGGIPRVYRRLDNRRRWRDSRDAIGSTGNCGAAAGAHRTHAVHRRRDRLSRRANGSSCRFTPCWCPTLPLRCGTRCKQPQLGCGHGQPEGEPEQDVGLADRNRGPSADP